MEGLLDRVEHGYAKNGSVKIHYVTLGEGPVIAMIHGFPDFWYTWRHQMTALAESHRVIALDLRGFNRSDKPKGADSYAMPVLVGDLIAVLDQLAAREALIMGHDWGAMVAWSLAFRHPERVKGLIICNLPHPRGLARELANNPDQQEASAYARRFQEPDSHQSLSTEKLLSYLPRTAPRQRYAEAFDRSDYESMMNLYRANYPREPYREARSPVVKVQCPVLMIFGLKDQALLPPTLNNTWEWLDKDLTLVTVPDAGHFVQQDKPEFVNRTIKAWLNR